MYVTRQKFIELTNAYKNSHSKKFCLGTANILYFSSDGIANNSSKYENCNSIVETFGGNGNSQLYYVQETYEEIKRLLNA